MSILNLRGTGSRRAIDKVAELRDENVLLLNRQGAADDFFALLSQDRDDANHAWQQEKQAREQAERAIVLLEAIVALRDREIADLKRKVDIGVRAEHVIAKTQEIDVTDLRQRFTTGSVRTLHAAADDGLLSPIVQIDTSGAKANPHPRPVSLIKTAA